MKVLIGSAAALFALATVTDVSAASRGSCSVTHHDCYPACVQMKMTPDGEDCAKTTQVCRDVCGAAPTYPGVTNTERVDIMRFETMKPLPDPDTEPQAQPYAPPQ